MNRFANNCALCRPNQSIKPAAPLRGNVSELATDPARGLSLSR
jgi:hypothetical protein